MNLFLRYLVTYNRIWEERYAYLRFLIRFAAAAQPQTVSDSLLQRSTLQNCIQYALLHQPLIHQSLLDEEITERAIQSNLADWYPQLNFNYNIIHYPQVPVSVVGGNPIQESLPNSSIGQFSLTQTLSIEMFYLQAAALPISGAGSSSKQSAIKSMLWLLWAKHITRYWKQNSNCASDEDIMRLRQSLKDAYEQYHGGVVDNIDYKRAMILLNNALQEKTQKRGAVEGAVRLSQRPMGCPMDTELHLEQDSTQMEHEAFSMRTCRWMLKNRIEYQELLTTKKAAGSWCCLYEVELSAVSQCVCQLYAQLSANVGLALVWSKLSELVCGAAVVFSDLRRRQAPAENTAGATGIAADRRRFSFTAEFRQRRICTGNGNVQKQLEHLCRLERKSGTGKGCISHYPASI